MLDKTDSTSTRSLAWAPTKEVLGPRLIEAAEAVADDFPPQHLPMRTLQRMEAVVWRWAKGEGRPLRRSTARVLHDAIKDNRRSHDGLILVPTNAWIRAHRNLQIGLELAELNGDYVSAPAPVVERVARALDALHGNNIADRRDPADPVEDGYKATFGKYRCVVPKTGKAINGLYIDGKLVDDPGEMDRAYCRSREFQERPAEVQMDHQLRYLEYYRKHVVKGREVCAEPLSVHDIYGIVVGLPDTAPGYGGVPYAVWRLIALTVSVIIRRLLVMLVWQPISTYNGIDTRKQIRVWIEKKGKPRHPDTMRGLGLSACSFRMLAAVIHEILRRSVAPVLHPAQLMVRQGAECMRWVEQAQRFLDGMRIEKEEETGLETRDDACRLVTSITRYAPPPHIGQGLTGLMSPKAPAIMITCVHTRAISLTHGLAALTGPHLTPTRVQWKRRTYD